MCLKPPGFDTDLFVTADLGVFYCVWLGRLPYANAIRTGQVRLEGPDAARARVPSLAPVEPDGRQRALGAGERLKLAVLLAAGLMPAAAAAQHEGHHPPASAGQPVHAMTGLFGPYPMSRESSGTSWQPESTPMSDTTSPKAPGC